MNAEVTLRPAGLEDARLLLEWRNDPVTRSASHNGAPVGRAEHEAWLARSLADPGRRLYVAETAGEPVGTVRADRLERGWELSWTVAPTARGRGVGTRAVQAALRARPGSPVWARVKVDNAASAAIARKAGMQLSHRDQQLLYFVSES
ncbi:MAG: GNAT family N-acetyltransferase [Candidatus Eremiobacteraeota bacterium]|nr:GNAT family N-acetyltransferase [Candidatus Eremiobacteraeota bacterium]